MSADAGAAVILEERDLDAAKMTVAIDSILSDRDRLKAMGEAARTLCSVDPTAAILADMQQHGGLR